MIDTDEPIGIGHNRPPLGEMLRDRFAQEIARVDSLKAMVATVALPITDDDALTKAGRIIQGVSRVTKELEASRVEEKEPFLTAGREVDAFFQGVIGQFLAVVQPLRRAADDYTKEKEAKARAAARAAEQAARAEEERQRRIAAEEAERNRPKSVITHEGKAELAGEQALENRVQARAPAAELTRVTTEDGFVASARQPWTFEIVDLQEVDLEALRPYFALAEIEKAIRGYVRANKGTAPLAGVRIFQETKASFR